MGRSMLRPCKCFDRNLVVGWWLDFGHERLRLNWQAVNTGALL